MYLLLAFSMFAGFGTILFFREFFSGFFAVLFGIIFIFLFALVNIFVKDIFLPLSYFKNGTILENLNSALQVVSLNAFKFFSYCVLKFILIIILTSGIVFMGLMSLGILFLIFIIPILGQTALQPVIYFLNLFGLNFFKSISNLEESY
ncbi:MAG: hypothetical protein WHV67_05575 [Thermoanaerobaculia bacterium]